MVGAGKVLGRKGNNLGMLVVGGIVVGNHKEQVCKMNSSGSVAYVWRMLLKIHYDEVEPGIQHLSSNVAFFHNVAF
jgi:hypothetical protein